MAKRVFSLSLVLFGFLVFGITAEQAAGSVGNCSVKIYAGTNPVEEFSTAKLLEHPDESVDIAVKLPGRTQSYILSRPSPLMRGWSASKDGKDDVTVTSPDGLEYIYAPEIDYKLAVIQKCGSSTVDDFESYEDNEDLRNTWKGCYDDDPRNGAVVYLGTYESKVYRGEQSMKFSYKNYPAYYDYSITKRTFDSPQDWTEGGRALSLMFYGYGYNVKPEMSLTLEDSSTNSATVTYVDSNDLLVQEWQQWYIDLQYFSANGVDLSSIAKISISLLGETVGNGYVWFDDIRRITNIVIFDYNDTNPNLIGRQTDGFDPNLYIEYGYNDSNLLETLKAFDHSYYREFTITYDTNDANGLVVAMSNPSCSSCGGGLRYEYDSNGLLQYVRDDGNNIVYEYKYDSNDRVMDIYLGAASGNNHLREFDYTDGGNGSCIVDIYDYIDANSYRVTREHRTSAGFVTKRIKYGLLNEDPESPTGDSFIEHILYDYDANNIMTRKVIIPALGDTNNPDPNSGLRKEYIYDPNTGGLLTEKWFDANDVNFTVISYTYDYILDPCDDILDVRVKTSTDAREVVTEYFYDGNDTDPNLKLMPEVTTGISGTQRLKYEYEYDSRNHVTLEKQLDDSNAVLVQTKYEYDNYGNLIKRYDDYGDSNEITEYEYNGFNEMVKMTLPSGVVQGWSHYDNGKVKYEVVYDPCDLNKAYSQTRYYYDPNGRLEKIAKADDTGIFTINSPNKWIWTKYEYDLQGNKTKVIEDVNGLDLEIVYEYNNQGEVTKVTLPNGKWTETVHDGRGLVDHATVGHGQTPVATTWFYYDSNGNIEWQKAPNGVLTKYEYDDFDRLKKVTRGL